MGIVILSTSWGIMTNQEARLEGIGGEILCYVCPLIRQGSFTWNKRIKKLIHEGLISKSLPIRVPLDNKDMILGYVSGEFYQRGIESAKV
ncbi:hypothetical protein Goklo_025991, partial [Gossypium klotzschianum]|nr:hypothetical protein [Gossypium klotzschianum]